MYPTVSIYLFPLILCNQSEGYNDQSKTSYVIFFRNMKEIAESIKINFMIFCGGMEIIKKITSFDKCGCCH